MLVAGTAPSMAGPFTQEDFKHIVPADKKLSQQWIKSLYARGDATFSRNGTDHEPRWLPGK